MGIRRASSVAVLVAFALTLCFGQDFGRDVDDLEVTSVSATTVRLTWREVESVDCQTSVTYSIFRDMKEDFTPSVSNRLASGLTKTTYLAKEPLRGADYYYYVRAFVTPVTCVPHSGTILVYPLDLGQHFTVEVGDDTGICTARSTSEMTCASPLPDFHAVIARQGTHEYLIGCRSADYEDGDWTCVNLTSGIYHVGVHSRTITVWDSGMSKVNLKTGKTLSPITPRFSVLARMQ
jgi:hypothetical protein